MHSNFVVLICIFLMAKIGLFAYSYILRVIYVLAIVSMLNM